MTDQKNNQELQMPFGAALFCMLFLLGSMVASMLWLDIPIHIDLAAFHRRNAPGGVSLQWTPVEAPF